MNKEQEAIVPFPVRRLKDWNAKRRAAIVQWLGLDEGSVVAVVGVPNASKTAFVISLCIASAARAERWLGLKIAGGPALYFGAEAPASVIMRAKAAAARNGNTNPALYVSAAIPALGGDASLIDAERIIKTAEEIASQEGEQVRLIAIDTLAACLAGADENAEGMLRLVLAAQRVALATSACVVLIHHPSKGDAQGLRGHGSLAAACDSIIRIDVDELTKVRTATLVKARDSATGRQLRYELHEVVLEERDSFGDPVTTIVVKSTDQEPTRARPSGRRQQELLTELERRHRMGDTAWDEATAREAGRQLGMHKNAARDAVKGLVSAGHLIGSPSSLTLHFPPDEGTKRTKGDEA